MNHVQKVWTSPKQLGWLQNIFGPLEVILTHQKKNSITELTLINSNGYDAEVRWGTLTDYFNAVHSRISRFDSLVGDFFVYSDVFSGMHF